MNAIDAVNKIGRKRSGEPKWEVAEMKRLDGHWLITGSVKVPFKSGPRKGEMKWLPEKMCDQFVVTSEEWEREVTSAI